MLVNQGHDALRGVVRGESHGGRQYAWSLFAKAAPVVGIKIPLSANGFFAIHQQAGFQAEFAVEVFQADLLAIRCVRRKITHRAEKMRVITKL